MEKKEFLLKIIKCMKGFSTAQEIKAEYNFISEYTTNPQEVMVCNIKNWLRWNFSENDPQFVIWERLKNEGF